METKNLNIKYCVGLGEILLMFSLPVLNSAVLLPTSLTTPVSMVCILLLSVLWARMPWAIQLSAFSMRRSSSM